MKVCWNVTNRCNEHCEYCFRELTQEPRSLEDNYRIIDNLDKLGVDSITFAGGEPLMYPYLSELMQYAYNKGIIIKLITNGSLLNITSEDILKYVTKITFSLDSTNPSINENLGRGKKHFENLKKLIPELHMKFPNIILEINSVVTKRYPNETNYIIDEINNGLALSGVRKLKVSRFDPLRGNALLMKDEFEMTDEKFESIKKTVKKNDLPFMVDFRNIEDIERNLIVSPNGSLTIAINSKDKVIVDDLSKDFGEIMMDLYTTNDIPEVEEIKGKVRARV